MSEEPQTSMAENSINSAISFTTNEDGETLLVTLEDSVISDQEISITESGVSVEHGDQALRDVLLISSINEGSGLLLKNGCSSGDDQDKEHISQNWFTSKTDKQSLREQGHRWRQGQWTTEENEVLKRNIAFYCQEKNISNPNSIIFDMTKDMRKDFYRFIARGLDRPLFAIYRRVLRMYDQKNHMGKYTAEEITKLRQLREQHGNDWATIGAALGRSAGSVRDRCRLMKDSCRYGTWAHEEEMKLAVAVYELSGAQPGEEVHHGLCWADVASRVKTRTDKQCRAKWLNFLNWKQKGGAEWSGASDDYILLEKIIASQAADENEVDWVELSKGWSCVRSPQWLRSKWWALKRHVTNYQNLPLSDILSTLSVVLLSNRNMRSDPTMPCSTTSKNSKLTAVGTTKFRLCNSADGYTLTTATVELPGGNRASVLPDDMTQLDSNSLFITPSNNSTFLISNDSISFPLSSLSEPMIVQSLPLVETSSKSESVGGTAPDDPSSDPCTDDIVLLGDVTQADECIDSGSTVLVGQCITLPEKSSLHHLSSFSDPLLNSRADDIQPDSYSQSDS
ncbi:cyclin-D-binding Myb-like transcription factor 1 [Watersipora subatra]|uniref:cyclin-D-binding Myb-like transcription factor 1 n=1 Tax=Watersipora subatra TaxID=2589382 RepID=UPI00355AD64A